MNARAAPGPDGGDDAAAASRARPGPIDAVELYWRPGCPFCTSLRWGLRRRGVATREVNIWAGDPSAAARVRAAAGGNETVPTVFIGERALLAPRVRDVLGVLAETSPHLLPERSTGEDSRGHALLRRLGLARRPHD